MPIRSGIELTMLVGQVSVISIVHPAACRHDGIAAWAAAMSVRAVVRRRLSASAAFPQGWLDREASAMTRRPQIQSSV
jgi:hypothetical protein